MQLNKNLFLKILLILGIISFGCDFEDKYVEPCAGKYGSQNFLDRIKNTYNKQHCYTYFGEWHKDYLAPKYNSLRPGHSRHRPALVPGLAGRPGSRSRPRCRWPGLGRARFRRLPPTGQRTNGAACPGAEQPPPPRGRRRCGHLRR